MDYFISDIHFGHKNVIRFCKRPFKTVSEMNNKIIEKWNNIVSDGDRVFVLGDVFLCPIDEAKTYIEQLNGYKVLIKGNHDFSEKVMIRSGFDEFHWTYDYEMPDGRIALLEHRPIPDCIIEEKYDLMMHGHIHISDKVRGKKINVSCDIWNFEPIPVDTLQELQIGQGKKDEFANFTISDTGMLEISANIPMEDYAGLTERIFKEMSKMWPNRRKK